MLRQIRTDESIRASRKAHSKHLLDTGEGEELVRTRVCHATGSQCVCCNVMSATLLRCGGRILPGSQHRVGFLQAPDWPRHLLAVPESSGRKMQGARTWQDHVSEHVVNRDCPRHFVQSLKTPTFFHSRLFDIALDVHVDDGYATVLWME